MRRGRVIGAWADRPSDWDDEQYSDNRNEEVKLAKQASQPDGFLIHKTRDDESTRCRVVLFPLKTLNWMHPPRRQDGALNADGE